VITIHGAYPKAGMTITSSAVIDPYKQLIEPSEGSPDPDNVKTAVVNVNPRTAVVNVTLDSIHVLQALRADDNHAWFMKFGIYDKGQSCTFFQDTKPTTVKDIFCFTHKIDPSDGDTVTFNDTHQLTLVESAPVLAFMGGVEVHESDGFLGIGFDIGGEFIGIAPFISLYPDYSITTPVVVPGAGATSDGKNKICGSPADGHCFDATYHTTPISLPPPLFKSSAFATTSAGAGASVTSVRSAATPNVSAAATTTPPPLPTDMQTAYNNFDNTLQWAASQATVLPYADWNGF
jgi:hypothetical protein